MDMQLTISVIVVGLSSCYLALRAWRLWSSKTGHCASGCGSSSAACEPPGGEKIVTISLERMKVRDRSRDQK